MAQRPSKARTRRPAKRPKTTRWEIRERAAAGTRVAPPAAVRLQTLRSDLGLSQESMAQVLGASARSVIRWEHDEARPGRLVLDRIGRVEDLIARARRLLGVKDAARWLSASNEALGGRSPIEHLRVPQGLDDIRDLLGRIEWGIPV